ncbi:FtsB family cell division protein [Bartonella ancashensis]|uniref:Cell division protein DivIC (FtsB), stabilizes FtsL against RasP cleavage n=1 Tax=Bartonella ancashensis TaxID=1318743 RepID=A0A0M5KSS3_9HYPH|nr:septum formation initiator family protein [Bartonella ancashensis]ALE03940.1 Cell division protein DivIC (FtsB), stabilizes FtsL against RasP cleavage [Bartonella ancashensis]
MWTKQKSRSPLIRFFLPFISALVAGYFCYHIYHGEYGLHSRGAVNERVVELREKLREIEAERLSIENRISLLYDGHIEKDMLDEYVRENLNFSKPNELTILVSPQ